MRALDALNRTNPAAANILELVAIGLLEGPDADVSVLPHLPLSALICAGLAHAASAIPRPEEHLPCAPRDLWPGSFQQFRPSSSQIDQIVYGIQCLIIAASQMHLRPAAHADIPPTENAA